MSRPRRLLQQAAGRHPRAAVAAATAVGWVTAPLGRGLDAAAIRRILPDLPPRELRRLRRVTWTGWLRLRVLEAGLSSPTARWPYPPLVAEPTEVRPPAVLVGFHAGPIPALGSLLERLPGEVRVLQYSGHARRRLTGGSVGTEAWQRAAALRAAVSTLRGGGSVFLLVDSNEFPTTIEVTLFGRRTRLARGAFALARITGSPVVPIAPRWRGSRVEIVVGDPIAPGDEAEMAAATARWLEDFVRATPEALSRLLVNGFWGEDDPPAAPGRTAPGAE
jgi:hypothetical protein